MPVQRSDLPFGSEFSPSQVDLRQLLELAHELGDDWHAFEDAVRLAYFEGNSTSEYNRRKLANNTKLGMIAYGLIDRDARLTELGQHLYAVRDDGPALYTEFARHILLNLHGLTLVQCVQDMQAAGETPDLLKLRRWLEERGIHFPRGGKHPSMMRLWLEKARIFTSGWHVSEARLQEVIGLAAQELEVLAGFTPEQRAYLKTLANLSDPGPYISNDVEKLATATYGVRFNEKGLARTVLYPLQDAGYITLGRGTREPGRGAKPSQVTPTAKLRADLVLPLLEQFEEQVGAAIRPFVRKPFADILQELRAEDRHTRGLALEALAFKLMRLIDLTWVATRLRGTATGGAEVDVIFESARLVFSRWQIQCKNTGHVVLDDVAKEVGLTHLLKSNVVVIVSTGEIGAQARRYANKIMEDSSLCVVMLDRADIEAIVQNPPAIVDAMNREAKHAMRLKSLQMQDV
ncbi:MAG: restriction endonuclease [Armatimonadetes bacterium]|nr:restriction endonuclease [Armatimonadota bacterium]